jgi:hypothetical protein
VGKNPMAFFAIWLHGLAVEKKIEASLKKSRFGSVIVCPCCNYYYCSSSSSSHRRQTFLNNISSAKNKRDTFSNFKVTVNPEVNSSLWWWWWETNKINFIMTVIAKVTR